MNKQNVTGISTYTPNTGCRRRRYPEKCLRFNKNQRNKPKPLKRHTQKSRRKPRLESRLPFRNRNRQNRRNNQRTNKIRAAKLAFQQKKRRGNRKGRPPHKRRPRAKDKNGHRPSERNQVLARIPPRLWFESARSTHQAHGKSRKSPRRKEKDAPAAAEACRRITGRSLWATLRNNVKNMTPRVFVGAKTFYKKSLNS